jgi:hypothetical protein
MSTATSKVFLPLLVVFCRLIDLDGYYYFFNPVLCHTLVVSWLFRLTKIYLGYVWRLFQSHKFVAVRMTSSSKMRKVCSKLQLGIKPEKLHSLLYRSTYTEGNVAPSTRTYDRCSVSPVLALFRTTLRFLSALRYECFIFGVCCYFFFFFIIWFVRLLPLRPLLAYCASLGW